MNSALLRLQSGVSALGLTLPDEALSRFDRYLTALLQWTPRLNLTAAGSADEIVAVHFIDSLLPLLAWPFPDRARVIDVGAGAGFPGIPLKIARPEVAVTLVDSSRRRIAFLEHVRQILEMPGLDVVWGRAEQLAHVRSFREAFDCAVERATAPTAAAVELCLPFAVPGGAALLLKGPRAEDEVEAARPLIAALGGGVVRAVRHTPPTTGRTTVVVVLQKAHPTPDGFPRGPARLGRAPVGMSPGRTPA